ncbi:hypothetical protein ASC63_03365 [Leifsonia sp. Root112D2]|nr:hypothetical protein ASC63_03365 [Leifsonia sp. Root112D2]
MRPPRHKFALINWLAVYPLITLILWLLLPLLTEYPLWITTLIVSLILVPLMNFLVMPLLLSLFAPWLTDRTSAKGRPDAQGRQVGARLGE